MALSAIRRPVAFGCQEFYGVLDENQHFGVDVDHANAVLLFTTDTSLDYYFLNLGYTVNRVITEDGEILVLSLPEFQQFLRRDLVDNPVAKRVLADAESLAKGLLTGVVGSSPQERQEYLKARSHENDKRLLLEAKARLWCEQQNKNIDVCLKFANRIFYYWLGDYGYIPAQSQKFATSENFRDYLPSESLSFLTRVEAAIPPLITDGESILDTIRDYLDDLTEE